MATKGEKKTKKETGIAVVTPQTIEKAQVRESASVEGFIEKAIAQNVPVETLERLLAMRTQLKEEHAREAFTGAMARFQAECPVIEKTKEVRGNNGQVAYRYAPIESIVSQVKDALKDNGFSYTTNMKLLEDGVSVTVKVTHILGHSEETEMTVPFGSKTQIMSQSQVAAAATTFAKRYAFLNAFGILTGDEDNDAKKMDDDEQAPPPAPRPTAQKGGYVRRGSPPPAPAPLASDNPVFASYKKRLKEVKSLDELKQVWSDIPVAAKKALEDVKDDMKAILLTEAGV